MLLLGALLVGLGSAAAGYFASEGQKAAAAAQSEAAGQAIDVQTEQFEATQELLNPYVEAGNQALEQQQALSGALGDEAQQQAVQGIQSSPQFAAMTAQGENAILQNASATGGLRGGNTQGALAQFRPQVLNSLINQRMGQLGGLTSLGQNAAAGVGNAGSNMAGNVGNLLQAQGLAQGQINQAGWNQLAGIPGGIAAGAGFYQGYGATQPTQPSTTIPYSPMGGGGVPAQLTQF